MVKLQPFEYALWMQAFAGVFDIVDPDPNCAALDADKAIELLRERMTSGKPGDKGNVPDE